MRSRITSAAVTALLAAGLAIPATGLAAGHGKHHAYGKGNPCPAHHRSGKHKGSAKGHKKGSGKGKKCDSSTTTTTTTAG